MNAEALIGTVLGTCTLQELIGQGGMGAVYLAQQSRPRRQVAVKVLMPMTPLAPNQLAAFLERFRRETDAAASLEHPNIVPVHEYGEQNGIAYLVMAYVAGGTLRDEMEREGQLALPKVVYYLDQLASALDFAHERGVIHRDIKPANILLTPGGRLLLTDFGLVKVVGTEQAPRVHLTGIGMPMGTPDYMAPEQVTGDNVDGRADLYALGVVLYQMLTGTTPFQGETPMQIAARHLQSPVPSPRTLRIDLPPAAEQVILRTLAKRPADRYDRAQDLANAFRIALTSAGVFLGYSQAGLIAADDTSATAARPFTRRGLFDPAWQGQGATQGTNVPAPAIRKAAGLLATSRLMNDDASASAEPGTGSAGSTGSKFTPAPPTADAAPPAARGLLTPLPGVSPGNIPTTPSGSTTFGNIPVTPATSSVPPVPAQPTQPARPPSGRSGLGVRTNLRRFVEGPEAMPTPATANSNGRVTLAPALPAQPTQPTLPTQQVQHASALTETGTQSVVAPTGVDLPAAANGNVTRVLPMGNVTRTLPVADSGQEKLANGTNGNTMKLPAAMKVVQVPVAGQPGRYVTGFLPVVSVEPETTPKRGSSLIGGRQADIDQRVRATWKQFNNLNMPTKIVTVLVAVVLVVSTSMLWLAHSRSGQAPRQTSKPTVIATPNLKATAAARATATADANILLSDPLSQNIHNWTISTNGTKNYIFEDGAYHITDNNSTQGAPALLPEMPPAALHIPLAYSLTMEEIKGNDSSVNNSFGLIFRFTTFKKGGKIVTTFYTFEVTNTKGGQYQFWKYNDTWGSSVSPWTEIWYHSFGKEFHEGHGSGSINTFKVFMNGSNFTFFVNGKQVGTSRDNSISSGQVGMLVNLQGTEVAFRNLILAYH